MFMQKLINVMPIFIVTFFMFALIFEVPTTPQTSSIEDGVAQFAEAQPDLLESEIAAARFLATIEPASGPMSSPVKSGACPCNCEVAK